MTDLYDLLLAQTRLVDYEVEISNHFENLAGFVSRLRTTPLWRIRNYQRIVGSARDSLASSHIRYVGFETELLQYNVRRRQVLEIISGHRILSKALTYFQENTEPDYQVPQSMHPALRYFDDELRTALNLRVIITASLIGAVVGAFLHALFSKL